MDDQYCQAPKETDAARTTPNIAMNAIAAAVCRFELHMRIPPSPRPSPASIKLTDKVDPAQAPNQPPPKRRRGEGKRRKESHTN
jgi:hypothetical protein